MTEDRTVALENHYWQVRDSLLSDGGARLLDAEQKYERLLTKMCQQAAQRVQRDFNMAAKLLPFWMNYSPRQRGRKPRGESVPWGEVGEKSIGANLLRGILRTIGDVNFPGLPFGGDTRFITDDAFIHFDLKLTGPNDVADELVLSPYQVSGDGAGWNQNGMYNSEVDVRGPRAIMRFRPELPPFYLWDEKVLLCLTYFVKAVYMVESIGIQPLRYFELVCVPNGLLLFAGPNYSQTPGLLTPGKDERDFRHKRTRIKLNPLAKIANWRCVIIEPGVDTWTARLREPH
jgi:hypothetical protein